MANVHDDSHTWDERGGNFDEGSHDQTRSEAGSEPPTPEGDSALDEVRKRATERLRDPLLFELNRPAVEGDWANLFEVRDLREVIRNFKKIPKRSLFGEFWKERELVILVSTTGAGKSLLSVQMANQIAQGGGLGKFASETEPQPVLYVDFENSDEDHWERAKWEAIHPNLKHVRVHVDATDEPDPEGLVRLFQKMSLELGSKVIILDNISYLFSELSKQDMHQQAGSLMKRLNRWRKTDDVAVLVVAHTNKDKSFTPFEKKDISGSSSISKFAERCICLGLSAQHQDLRYMKSMKGRSKGKGEYNSERWVSGFKIQEVGGLAQLVHEPSLDGPEAGFLRSESTEPSKGDLAKGYFQANPNVTGKELMDRFGISKAYASAIKNSKQ